MTAAIVVPIYKPHRADLKWFERISLQRCVEVFGGKYPIVFVAPDDREFDYLPFGDNFYIVRFEAKYFRGRDGYNESTYIGGEINLVLARVHEEFGDTSPTREPSERRAA